jgi:hypothetical protein
MASASHVPDRALASGTATPDAPGSPAAGGLSGPRTPSESPTPAVTAGSSSPAASGESLSAGKSTCGKKLAFGEIAACSSISGDEQHVYRVTSKVDSDTLITQLTRGSGDWLSAQVSNADGEGVCALNVDADTCQLGAAGTYTITVWLDFGGSGDYTLAVESTRTRRSA